MDYFVCYLLYVKCTYLSTPYLVFEPIQIPKKKFFEFLSPGLCTGPKGEKGFFMAVYNGPKIIFGPKKISGYTFGTLY